MGTSKKGGYIEKLLKKADNALQEGIKKADEVLDNAVELGIMTTKQAGKTSKELRNKADNALQEGIKKADEVLDNAVELGIMTTKQAGKTSKELRNKAKKERRALQERGIEKISEGISAAKSITSDTQNDLETLKKLGKLRKAEVITEKEFQAKKKKILDRI